MGTKSSKNERISSAARKRCSQDDLATQQTEDSSVSASLKDRLNSRMVPTEARWPSMLPSNEPSRRYELEPWEPDGSKSEPVKLPQASESSLQQESEEAQYLAKMYDTRTWEMYHRITEARKNSPYQQNTVPLNQKCESTSEWENLQQEEEASPGGEMIFLFDFEQQDKH